MFNNPLAKDLCVDINAGYLLQTGLRGGKHTDLANKVLKDLEAV